MTETEAPPATDDGLSDYARTRSPDSFRRLVDRHLPLVYAAARRQVRDPALAEDVAQAVFLILADKAPTLRAGQPLAPWLLRVTHYAAANARRARARRARARQAHHERKAAAMAAQRSTPDASRDESPRDKWSPLLDEGINRLKRRDRDAIVLRYLEQRPTRDVAASLGISESAAAKRIERAVARLRDFFARRGATVSAAALATTLAARSTEAAPPHLAASIGGAAAAGATAAGVSSIAKGALVAMTYAKTKTVLISVLAGTLVVGGSSIVLVNSLATADPATSSAAKPTPSGVGTPAPLPTVTFSDNATATLVAVADNPDTGRWWAPDGSPIPAPNQAPPNRNRIWVPPSTRAFYLVVRHQSPAPLGDVLHVGLRQPTPAAANTGQFFGPNVRVIGYTVAVPNEHATVDLVLSVGHGPWTVDERVDLRTLPAAHPAPSDPPRRRVIGIGEEGGQLTVTLDTADNPAFTAGQYEVLALTADGREVPPNRVDFRFPNHPDFQFPLRRDQAAILVHRWRPYETREIRNISLAPGARTNPTTVTPAP